MDRGQQYETHDYGYSGSDIRRYKAGDFVHENRPYYSPDRRDAYEHKLLVSSVAHTRHGFPTVRCSLGGEVPYLQPALGVSPFSNPYIATSAETSEKNYAYSGNISPQGIANGYGPAGSASQDERRSRVQVNGSPGLMQARSEPFWHPSQRYLGSISPYGSNTDSRPNPSPMEQIFAPLNDAPSFPHPEFSTTCANCRNRFQIDGVPDYHPNQRDSNSTTDWTFQGPKNYFLRQTEGVVPSNRQLPNQDTRRIAPQNGHLDDVPHLEESRSRFSFQKPAVANVPDNPPNVHADKDAANDDLPKKRKRKPRIFKPRKPRTLTEEGKAHAKAIRECPGGACADCRIKKTKCTHKLPEDIPMDLHDKRTPNTPWTEPLTPEFGPGHDDPVFYRSSQEDDFAYEDVY